MMMICCWTDRTDELYRCCIILYLALFGFLEIDSYNNDSNNHHMMRDTSDKYGNETKPYLTDHTERLTT